MKYIKKLFIFVLAFIFVFALASCKKDDSSSDGSSTDGDTTSTYYLPSFKNVETIEKTTTFNNAKISTTNKKVYEYIKMNDGANTFTDYINYLLINKDKESVNDYVELSGDGSYLKAFAKEFIKSTMNESSNSFYISEDVITEYFNNIYKIKNNNNAKFTGFKKEYTKSNDFYDALKNINTIFDKNYTELNVESFEYITDSEDPTLINYSDLYSYSEELCEIILNAKVGEYTNYPITVSTNYDTNLYVVFYKSSADTGIIEETFADYENKDDVYSAFIDEYLEEDGSIDQVLCVARDTYGFTIYDRDFAYSYQQLFSSCTQEIDYKSVDNFEDDTDKNTLFSFNEKEYTVEDFYNYIKNTDPDTYTEALEDALMFEVIKLTNAYKTLVGEDSYTDLCSYTDIKEDLDNKLENATLTNYLDDKNFYQYTVYGTEDYDLVLESQFKEKAENLLYIESLLTKGTTTRGITTYSFKDETSLITIISNAKNTQTLYKVVFTYNEKADINSVSESAIEGFVSLIEDKLEVLSGDDVNDTKFKEEINSLLDEYNKALSKDDPFASAISIDLECSTTTSTGYLDGVNLTDKFTFVEKVKGFTSDSKEYIYAVSGNGTSDFTCILKYKEGESNVEDTANPWFNKEADTTYSQLAQALVEYIMYSVDDEYSLFTYYSNNKSLFTNYINEIMKDTTIITNYFNSVIVNE